MAGRSRALFASRNGTKRHDLAFFASHFRDRVHLKKKYHLESGLYQRDEDPHDFSVKQVPMSPRENSLSGGVQYRYKTTHKENPLPENPDATSLPLLSEAPRQNPDELIVVRPTKPLGTAFTTWVVRNPGAGLLEDSPTRASPKPQVDPLAPFHGPVPGPGHATQYLANVPWRPRLS